MNAREAKVREIISAAYEGAEKAIDDYTTSDEVFSAYITMARNAVVVARRAGADMARVREVLYSIMMEAHGKEIH